MPRKRSTIPWLKERGGIFYVFQYNATTRRTDRRSLKTDDEATARRIFAEYLNGTRSVTGQPVGGDAELKVEAALDFYFNEHVDKNCITRGGIRTRLSNLKQHFTGVVVKSIDIPMCEAYRLRRLRGEIGTYRRNKIVPVKDVTIRSELAMLVAAIEHNRKRKWADGRPRVSLADIPYVQLPPDAEPRERFLTHDELAKLRNTAALMAMLHGDHFERVQWLIEIAYYTASRRRAIETLTKGQVSLDLNRIALAKPGERKTKKRRPIVPIHPDLRPLVEKLKGQGDGPWLLGVSSVLSRPFREVCDAAGLKGVTPHTLRHTRATHLLWEGVDIWTVAKLLGDTVKTVEKTYGHHCPEHMAEAMQRRKEEQ